MARNKSDELVVHGTRVDSINEYNVAQALDKLNMDYEYQYIFGMAGIRGSQIIDFLVYTLPKPTPLFVHGEYWHSGKFAADEALKLADIDMRMRGTWAQSVVIWEHECEDEDQAFNSLREKLGV